MKRSKRTKKSTLPRTTSRRKPLRKPEECGFKMPSDRNPANRKTSIRAATWAHIMPRIRPTADEVVDRLGALGIEPAKVVECIYCGKDSDSWDHLNPIVEEGKSEPTGFFAEINNLVPSCLSCNSSKGNKQWAAWMASDAKKSPTNKGTKGRTVIERIQALQRFCQAFPPQKKDMGEWAESLELRTVKDAIDRVEQAIDELHRAADVLKKAMR